MAREQRPASDQVPVYLDRLTQAALLTKEEERHLTVAARNGDKEARDRLISANMRLVINVARAYKSHSIPLDDLVQEGAIGLIRAIDRFDPSKGFRFSTYATHWIRQAVGRAVEGNTKTIRLPAHVSQALRKIERERDRFAQANGRDPELSELSTIVGLSVEKLATLRDAAKELVSLDAVYGEEERGTLGSMIRDAQASDAEQLLVDAELSDELRDVLGLLSDRERAVVSQRFNNDEHSTEFRDDLAAELKISRERVRQIEVQAIKKLRALAARHRISEYLSP